jgi:GT2 family glycosyltransferase
MSTALPSPALSDVPRVSVVVVNYNGLRFVEAFFRSLGGAFSRHTHEVIVVDNASTDGSLDWLRARRDIRLIESPENLGFTGGNNLGAAHARGDVLLLINNDTELHGGLDALVDAALDPAVGAAGCRLQYGDGRLQHSVGLEHTTPRIVLSWLGLEKHRWAPPLLRKFETAPDFYAHPHARVAWVSGACLATRRDVWERLGGLDDDLFMYCEDVDYCHRARDAGLRVAYVAQPVVTHFEGGGKAWVGPGALLRTVRSYFIYVRKVRGPWSARGLCAALGGVFALRGLAFGLKARLAAAAGRPVQRSKADGYRVAALTLARAAWSGRTPPLP